MRISLIGGTGREGRGLALRWAKAGHQVAIGSRDGEKARAKAAELSGLGVGTIQGGDNSWAASQGEVVVLTVPYAAHAETLRGLTEQLQGRILVDITVPLQPPKVLQVFVPPGQAAALEAQAIVGPAVPVVASLHHVSSTHLGETSEEVDCDVLLCGDDEHAKQVVTGLIGDLGLRALDAGPLRNAIALEALTPVLLQLGKKYKRAGVGVRFTGIGG